MKAEAEAKPVVPVASRPQLRPLPSSRSASQQSGTFAAAAMAARRKNAGTRTIVRQRTSLSSLKDFVPAELPAPAVGRDVSSDDQVEDDGPTIICVQRLALGATYFTSPNRKGSRLLMKSRLASSQLVFEWQGESKVVLHLPFDAVFALQVGFRSAHGSLLPAEDPTCVSYQIQNAPMHLLSSKRQRETSAMY